MLTEAEVERSFRKMFRAGEKVTADTFEKAEQLLEEELRPESPLRYRLQQEMEELRKLHDKKRRGTKG